MSDPADPDAHRDDELPDLEGPAEDDAEASYDPDGIELGRAQELGLSISARDGDDGQLDGDDLTAADAINGDDASDLGIDEEFDTEDEGEEAERQDDRATFKNIPQSDYRR